MLRAHPKAASGVPPTTSNTVYRLQGKSTGYHHSLSTLPRLRKTLNRFSRNPSNSSLHRPYLLKEDIRRYTYAVPNTPLYTNIDMQFLINYDLRIERPALGRTILNGLQRLQAHIAAHGDTYLLPDDDPWQVDDKRTGESPFLLCPSLLPFPSSSRVRYYIRKPKPQHLSLLIALSPRPSSSPKISRH